MDPFRVLALKICVPLSTIVQTNREKHKERKRRRRKKNTKFPTSILRQTDFSLSILIETCSHLFGFAKLFTIR